MYYAMLLIGVVLLFIGFFWFIYMFKEKEFTISNTFKALISLILSGLLLVITLPSLKFMLFKEYDVVKGNCTIEIDSSGRTSEASFKMDNSADVFYFREKSLTWILMEGQFRTIVSSLSQRIMSLK